MFDVVRKTNQGFSMLDNADLVFFSYLHDEEIGAHLHFEL